MPADLDAPPAAATTETIAARAATITPQRYRTVPTWPIAFLALFLVAVLSPVLPALAADPRRGLGLVCLTPFVAIYLAWLVSQFKVLTVDATGLRVRDGWRTATDLSWEAIAGLRGQAFYGYSLCGSHGKCIALPNGAAGQEILDIARHVRPDLWPLVESAASDADGGERARI
jgi:hypothetical protein